MWNSSSLLGPMLISFPDLPGATELTKDLDLWDDLALLWIWTCDLSGSGSGQEALEGIYIHPCPCPGVHPTYISLFIVTLLRFYNFQ